jgi:hypothetical protein
VEGAESIGSTERVRDFGTRWIILGYNISQDEGVLRCQVSGHIPKQSGDANDFDFWPI